jgi:hypothetical protein
MTIQEIQGLMELVTGGKSPTIIAQIIGEVRIKYQVTVLGIGTQNFNCLFPRVRRSNVASGHAVVAGYMEYFFQTPSCDITSFVTAQIWRTSDSDKSVYEGRLSPHLETSWATGVFARAYIGKSEMG